MMPEEDGPDPEGIGRIELGETATLDFDPLTASEARLDELKLVSRPDPAIAPELECFWRRLMRAPGTLHPTIEIRPQYQHEPRIGRRPTGAGAVAGRWMTSRNWSGAVAAATHGRTFRTVAGRWIVPKPEAPPGASATNPPPGGAWQTSVWIGLDGWRRHSRSLPQMGTVSAVEIHNGQLVPTTYLFVQWWVRGRNDGEVRITNFPVNRNDEIMAYIEVVGSGRVRFNVWNRTQQTAMLALDWRPGQLKPGVPPNPPVLAPVEGRHAVWCVERPLTLPTPNEPVSKLFRLPRFGAATFGEALALARHRYRPGARPVAVNLRSARKVRMTDTGLAIGRRRIAVLTSPTPPARGHTAIAVEQIT